MVVIRTLAAQTRSPGFKTTDFSYPLITVYDTLKQVFHTRQSELWRSIVVLCFVWESQSVSSFLNQFCVPGCVVKSVGTSWEGSCHSSKCSCTLRRLLLGVQWVIWWPFFISTHTHTHTHKHTHMQTHTYKCTHTHTYTQVWEIWIFYGIVHTSHLPFSIGSQAYSHHFVVNHTPPS